MAAVAGNHGNLLLAVAGLVRDIIMFVLLHKVETPSGRAVGVGPVFAGLEQRERVDLMVAELTVVVDAGLGRERVTPCRTFGRRDGGSARVGRATVRQISGAGGGQIQHSGVIRGRERLHALERGVVGNHLLEGEALDERHVVAERHIRLHISVARVAVAGFGR